MKFLFSLAISLSLTIPCLSFAQTTESFSVFKLKRKIGNEVAATTYKANDTTIQVNITTNDRGSVLKLQTSLLLQNKAIRYSSTGNTSRFKTEKIDTLGMFVNRFPVSNNGSIKIKELLVSYWNKRGRPANIPPFWGKEETQINILGKEKNPLGTDSLLV